MNVTDQFMKSMAKEGGLEITANNHPVRKTTVRMLNKAGASSREIMAIRMNKDYDDLDLEDHLHVGKVLSGKKPSEAAVKTHQQTLSSLSSPPVSGSFPWYFKTVM